MLVIATGYCSAFPQPRSLMSSFTLAAASSLTSRAPSTGMCFGSASGQSSFSKPVQTRMRLLTDNIIYEDTAALVCTCPEVGQVCMHGVHVGMGIGKQEDQS
jgi:hypothetical protein